MAAASPGSTLILGPRPRRVKRPKHPARTRLATPLSSRYDEFLRTPVRPPCGAIRPMSFTMMILAGVILVGLLALAGWLLAR